MQEGSLGSVFWSYSRDADSYENNDISELRKNLARAIRIVGGIDIDITIDSRSIRVGEHLENRIRHLISGSACMITVIAPTYFTSEWCKLEYNWFLEQQRLLGREDLILPILYREIKPLPGFDASDSPEWKEDIFGRNYLNWTDLRNADADSSEYKNRIEKFANAIWELVSSIPVPLIPGPDYEDYASAHKLPGPLDPDYTDAVMRQWAVMTETQRRIIKTMGNDGEKEFIVDDLYEALKEINEDESGLVIENRDELYYRARALLYQGYLRMKAMGARQTIIGIVPEAYKVLGSELINH
jgi:hypothetical protein